MASGGTLDARSYRASDSFGKVNQSSGRCRWLSHSQAFAHSFSLHSYLCVHLYLPPSHICQNGEHEFTDKKDTSLTALAETDPSARFVSAAIAESCMIQIGCFISGHERSLTQIKFNKEGDLLFSCSKDHIINVWFTHNGERLGTYDGHNGTVWTVDVDCAPFHSSAGSKS